MSSRNDASSNGSRNFVSSSSPICFGEPNESPAATVPGSSFGPPVSTAFSAVPSSATHSSTKSTPPKTQATALRLLPGCGPSGSSWPPTYATTKT